MSGTIENDEARLLTAAEQEAVNLTLPPAVAGLSRQDLMALARRLREARDRARAIASQQRREMRGKAAPRGATPARDDAGTVAKAQVLADAVKRISGELRQRSALAAPPGATVPGQPGDPAAKTPSSKAKMKPPTQPGTAAQPSKRATVRVDPREVGRVSKSVKSAQARRDAKPH